MARVAVDAMGGDHAPDAVVEGAVRASRDHGVPVVLVGPPATLTPLTSAFGAGEGIEVVEALDVISMDEPDPARSVRKRKQSTVSVMARLVREGRADAAFSAGPTGAALAAAVLEMGRIRGVQRPAIMLAFPFPQPTLILDLGANADVRPQHLASFAVLGSTYAEVVLGLDRPAVGLLSIGEEMGKGNELVKEAFPLLEASGLNFVGNVEGRDIVAGVATVVVTDGFTGNILLKAAEGLSGFFLDELDAILTADEDSRRAGGVISPGVERLRERLNPEAYGGAHLLGVNGVCIIGHGSSNARAVSSAIHLASQAADSGYVSRVAERLSKRIDQGR